MAVERAAGGTSLIDVLDRVLDKGLLIAGDIRVSLAEVELLTIRIRLIVCSIDKAQEIGMDWWRTDPHFSGAQVGRSAAENQELKRHIRALERRIEALSGGAAPPAVKRLKRARRVPSR